MPHILRRLKINEVSSVDRGANQGAKVMLMKRHDDKAAIIDDGLVELAGYIDSIMVNKNIVDKDAEISACIRSFGGYLKRNVVTDDDDDDPADDGLPGTPRPLEKLNELVAALTSFMPSLSPAQAVRFLATPPGAAFITSLSKKDTPMTTRSEQMVAMRKFIQDGGMSAVAKRILETGSTSLSEHEYTELVQENATRKGISFEKAFQDRDTQLAYKIVRDATQMKAYMKSFPNRMSIEPVMVGGEDATAVNDPVKAAADLQALVEAQRKLAPTLTTSALYDAVMRNPANKEIVDRAFRRPTASSPSYDSSPEFR